MIVILTLCCEIIVIVTLLYGFILCSELVPRIPNDGEFCCVVAKGGASGRGGAILCTDDM